MLQQLQQQRLHNSIKVNLDFFLEDIMDEIFAIIGKMYLDIVQSQKTIVELQKQIETKDKEITTLHQSILGTSQD